MKVVYKPTGKHYHDLNTLGGNGIRYTFLGVGGGGLKQSSNRADVEGIQWMMHIGIYAHHGQCSQSCM